MTPSLGSSNNVDVSADIKQLTSTLSGACTNACTSEAENDNAGTSDAADRGSQAKRGEELDQGDTLDTLAAALLTLSPTDRERLTAMLKGDNA